MPWKRQVHPVSEQFDFRETMAGQACLHLNVKEHLGAVTAHLPHGRSFTPVLTVTHKAPGQQRGWRGLAVDVKERQSGSGLPRGALRGKRQELRRMNPCVFPNHGQGSESVCCACIFALLPALHHCPLMFFPSLSFLLFLSPSLVGLGKRAACLHTSGQD
ncbi:uncharacterized protein LOC119029961 isoform X21 [Acanthopagrus latus]|nr:uncharacterized protein LOC119029961 isoform X21 [Acanthopagrus latus]